MDAEFQSGPDLFSCLSSLQQGQRRVERQLDAILKIVTTNSCATRTDVSEGFAHISSERDAQNDAPMGSSASASPGCNATDSMTALMFSERSMRCKGYKKEDATRLSADLTPNAEDELGCCMASVQSDMFRPDVNRTCAQRVNSRLSSTCTTLRRELEVPIMYIQGAVQGMLTSNKCMSSAVSLVSDHHDQKQHACMLHPNSWQRVLLDICGVFVLFVELSVTPYSLAWELPAETLQHITYFTLSFWSSDMLCSFRTGFFWHGRLEMNPAKVARHYGRTYFFPDLLLICIDMLGILQFILVDSASSSRAIMITRFARTTRALRILKVLRVSHLYDRISKLKDTFFTHHSSKLVVEILEMFIMVIWINHVVACGWFALAHYMRSDTGSVWLDKFVAADSTETYSSIDAPFQYTTSLHWALTQMTPGSMAVSPTNTVERVYNILVLLFGMFVFSSIVSTISSKMVQFKLSTQAKAKTMAQLRTFMMQNRIRTDLAVMIQEQVKENLNATRKLVMKDLTALNLLNASLRAELHAELCHPHLCQHRVLLVCIWSDCNLPQLLCRNQVVDNAWFVRGKSLFVVGLEADALHHVISGDVLYTRDGHEQNFDCRSWFSDISLFVSWRHVGSLRAETSCETLTIRVTKLMEALNRVPVILEFLSSFARAFLMLLASRETMEEEIDDCALSDEIVEDCFLALSSDCQMFVALTCAHKLHASEKPWAQFSRRIREKRLEEEIRSRSCLIYPGEDLEVHRVVAVVAIKLVNEDGRTFVEIGKKEHGQVKATCKFPGKKARLGEALDDVLERVLSVDLAVMRQFIDIETSEDTISLRPSASFGVTTKYLKRTYSATASKSVLSLPCVQIESHIGSLQIYSFASDCDNGENISYYAWLKNEDVVHMFDTPTRERVEWDRLLSHIREIPMVNL